jgi:oxygen-independent coproporphyrinogen III oxidase
MGSLYIHIPFCKKKCYYCSFSSCVNGGEIYHAYADALQKELAAFTREKGDSQLRTVFIGGGTPSVFPCSLLVELICNCSNNFSILPDAEITVEVNPGTVNEQYVAQLLAIGVNRISLGVQTFNDRELHALGRIHDSSKARAAFEATKKAGCKNISLDLMFGIPGQNAESWRSTLGRAISLGPQHLSLYQLTIEEGTPFYLAYEAGELTLPDENEILLMDEITNRLCGNAGFKQYEISNFSLSGHECAHNINYWQNANYIAAGAAAVSCINGVRERRVADPGEYIRRIQARESVIIDRECLSLEASFRETVIMGLRMTGGVGIKQLTDRYHIDLVEYYGGTLSKLLAMELVALSASSLRLTDKGRSLANWVMAELV